jgi:hypothetical protein
MVGVEQADAKGGLTPAQILEAVRARKPDINACYEAALQKRPTLAGKVVVTWTITVDGRSENVALKSTTLGDPTAESCILAHVAKLVFPAPPNRIPAHVSFPFLFQPRGDR